jgi:hypothetical protein
LLVVEVAVLAELAVEVLEDIEQVLYLLLHKHTQLL